MPVVVYAKVANTYLSKRLHKEKVSQLVALTARRASRFDPLEGKYSFALGSAQIFLNQPENALELRLYVHRRRSSFREFICRDLH